MDICPSSGALRRHTNIGENRDEIDHDDANVGETVSAKPLESVRRDDALLEKRLISPEMQRIRPVDDIRQILSKCVVVVLGIRKSKDIFRVIARQDGDPATPTSVIRLYHECLGKRVEIRTLHLLARAEHEIGVRYRNAVLLQKALRLELIIREVYRLTGIAFLHVAEISRIDTQNAEISHHTRAKKLFFFDVSSQQRQKPQILGELQSRKSGNRDIEPEDEQNHLRKRQQKILKPIPIQDEKDREADQKQLNEIQNIIETKRMKVIVENPIRHEQDSQIRKNTRNILHDVEPQKGNRPQTRHEQEQKRQSDIGDEHEGDATIVHDVHASGKRIDREDAHKRHDEKQQCQCDIEKCK